MNCEEILVETLPPEGGFVFAIVYNIQAEILPEYFWAIWDTVMEFENYWKKLRSRSNIYCIWSPILLG